MADVDITYGCGCGFKTKRPEAAIEHSDNRHHIMEVRGSVKPATLNPTSPASNRRPRVDTEAVAQGGTEASRIEALRQKIGKGG